MPKKVIWDCGALEPGRLLLGSDVDPPCTGSNLLIVLTIASSPVVR